MHRLDRTDALFLDLESERVPCHTLKIGLVRLPDGVGIDRLRRVAAVRLPRLAPFTWRLASTPADLGRPVWVEDPDLDVEAHLRTFTLPAPGGDAELCALVARAAEAPLLDRGRPLWEAWLVDGLADGRFAVIVRLHHAVADGVSSGQLLAMAFDDGEPLVPPAARLSPWLHSARTLAHEATSFALDAGTMALAAARAGAEGEFPLPASVPRSPLTGALGTRRGYASTQLDLATLAGIKNTAGVTLNDVFLALVAGALRRVLGSELPRRPLVAGVPVSRLPVEERRPYGNRGLTTMYPRLPTDEPDPATRLRRAHEYAAEAKAQLDSTVGARVDDVFGLAGRTVTRAVRPVFSSPLASLLAVGGSVTVSNVRGPAELLHADGIELDDFFSIGPCAPGCRLNVTAWSYAGRFNISVLADPDAVDAWDVVDGLRAEVEELVEALRPR